MGARPSISTGLQTASRQPVLNGSTASTAREARGPTARAGARREEEIRALDKFPQQLFDEDYDTIRWLAQAIFGTECGGSLFITAVTRRLICCTPRFTDTSYLRFSRASSTQRHPTISTSRQQPAADGVRTTRMPRTTLPRIKSRLCTVRKIKILYLTTNGWVSVRYTVGL